MIINNVERESNREKKNTLVEKADYRLKEKTKNDCCWLMLYVGWKRT